MDFSFREGTFDSLIFEEIFRDNVYRLPKTLAEDDIIIDVGAHAGFFTGTAIERGARTVYAVEADFDNYLMAEKHLKEYIDQGMVDLRWGAVWRSDGTEQFLYQSEYYPAFDSPWECSDNRGTRPDDRTSDFPYVEGMINTGAVNVLWQTEGKGKKVPVILFDELILQATKQGQKRIRLLKIDCEGSEWPILFTSKTLHLIDEICGEYHEIGGEHDILQPEKLSLQGFERFTIHELLQFLDQKNFRTVYVREKNKKADGSPIPAGMFFATHS